MANTIISSFDVRTNFWIANPASRTIKEINTVYEQDKSAEKAKSSLLMWGVTMLIHPRFPATCNLEYDARLKLVNDDFLDKIKLDPEVTHKELIVAYEKGILTRLERIAKEWGDKLDERFKLLREIKYDLANAEDLDKMMARTDKLWQQYITCLKDLDMESAKSQVQGGAVESLLESGLI